MHPFLRQHLDSAEDVAAATFTSHAALRAGVPAAELRTLVKEQRLRRPVRGTYQAADFPDDVAARIAALLLVVPRDAFLCDETAAYVHGADGAAQAPNDDLRPHVVRCFRPAESSRVRRAETRGGERTLDAGDLVRIGGLTATSPLRTALDLGRLRKRDRAMAAMDALAAAASFGADDLVPELPRFRRQRGVVQLRELAPLVDRGAQSPPESVLRLAWHDAGLPAPETQIEVVLDGVPRFLDVGTRAVRFAAEYDGAEFHSDPQQVHDDLERRRLFSAQRWHVEVFTARDLYGPGADPVGRLIRTFRDHIMTARPGMRHEPWA